MPTKISNATKRLALEKLRSGMTRKEVADMTGVSVRTIERWQAAQTKTAAKPAGTTPPAAPAPASPEPATQSGAVDFADSPAPIEDKQKSLVDKGLDKVKALLGIEEKPGDKTPTPPAVALTPKQKAFVESVAPIMSLGFVALGAAIWYRIGPEYKLLAPKEDVAQRIIEPLVRIYARHVSFVPEVNPDWTDVGASMFALMGYIHASLELYEHIKEDKEAYDNEHGIGAYRARITGANVVGAENGTGRQNGRYADVSRASQAPAGEPGTNGQYAGAVGSLSLTEKEQRQFEKLSLLSQRDFESRARRSGQF